MHFAVVVLAAVLALIAVRQLGRFRLQIWQIMAAGAFAVLIFGQISVGDAVAAINLDVISFLFGMFVLGYALEESGYLGHLAYRIFKTARNADELLLLSMFVFGVASSLLMNDTVAIVGTPVVLYLAKKHNLPVKMMLLALAFAVTIGSVASPIGNPQNLLVAFWGDLGNPFLAFLGYLLVPTLINLLAAFLALRLFFRGSFRKKALAHIPSPITDGNLAFLCRVSLAILLLAIVTKALLVSFLPGFELRLTYIAAAAAAPLLAFSRRRFEIMRRIDWHTLVFFASMFVLMESVWDAGFFQSGIAGLGIDVKSVPWIFALSIGLSQLISNVPLVALYLPVLKHAGAGVREYMALAAASTISGNLSPLGAASNVIIIQNAEKRSGGTLSLMDFARIGIPLTLLNAIVLWFFV